MQRFLLVMLTGAIVCAAENSFADFIPVSSALSLVAQSDAGGGFVTAVDGQSQIGTLNPLTAFVDSIATFGNASVETTARGLATWTSPDVGHVELSNVGFTTIGVRDGSAYLWNGLDYQYTFTADKDGILRLNYSLTTIGNSTFGLVGFNLNFSGQTAAMGLENPVGMIIESVSAGSTYTLTLKNGVNIHGGLGNLDSHMTGVFDFDFLPGNNAVPEPSTFALAGLGCLGLVVSAIRRRPASLI